MKYQMKQKFFGADGTFTVDDENGRPAYKAEAKRFSLMKKIDFYDLAGNQVAHVEHKFGLRPVYEITLTGQEPIKLIQKFKWIGKKFEVAAPGAPIEIEGSFWGYNYQFTQGGKQLATASKKMAAMRDSFVLDVTDNENPVLLIASMVAVDLIVNSEKHK